MTFLCFPNSLPSTMFCHLNGVLANAGSQMRGLKVGRFPIHSRFQHLRRRKSLPLVVILSISVLESWSFGKGTGLDVATTDLRHTCGDDSLSQFCPAQGSSVDPVIRGSEGFGRPRLPMSEPSLRSDSFFCLLQWPRQRWAEPGLPSRPPASGPAHVRFLSFGLLCDVLTESSRVFKGDVLSSTFLASG